MRDAPSSLRETDKTETTITVAWDAVEHASGYQFVWKNKVDSSYSSVKLDASTTSYTLDGLDADAVYCWRVRTLGDNGVYLNSAYSAMQTVSLIDLVQLDSPCNLRETDKTETTITVSWDAVENANGYQFVWKNKVDSSYSSVMLNATTTSYLLDDLDSAATYYWRVRALGDNGAYLNSAYSAKQIVKLPQPLDASSATPASFATLDIADELFEELDDEDYDLLAANFIV